ADTIEVLYATGAMARSQRNTLRHRETTISGCEMPQRDVLSESTMLWHPRPLVINPGGRHSRFCRPRENLDRSIRGLGFYEDLHLRPHSRIKAARPSIPKPDTSNMSGDA